MADLSLLIVNYRSAALTAEAVRSARDTFPGEVEIVIVDNSEDDAETSALRNLGADAVVRAPRNLGYGSAINLGRSSCSARVIAFSNPDVEFHPNCLSELLKAVDSGAALAGPRFCWDRDARWTLPLPQMPTPLRKWGEIAALRSAAWSVRRNRRMIRKRIRQWRAAAPMRVEALSGALICMRSEVFDRLGGFDERFFLYFEEIDLARRARSVGPVVYVPQAVCRHLFSQTTPDDVSANAHYMESERRFFDKWYGRRGASTLRSSVRLRQDAPQETLTGWSLELPGPPERYLVEASPSPHFPSAAGHFPTQSLVRLPQEIVDSYRGARLYLRVAELSGRVVRTVAFVKNG